MKGIVLVAVMLVLAGCAIAPPRYLAPQVEHSSPDTQVVSIERAKWLGNSSVPLYVFVDGEKVASLGGGQVINLHLPLGRRIIGVGFAVGDYPGGKADRSIAVDVTKDHAPILRATMAAMGYGGWKITQIK